MYKIIAISMFLSILILAIHPPFMVKCMIMTYLIIGNHTENIKDSIKGIVKKFWKEEPKDNILESTPPDIHILSSSNTNSIGINDVKELQKKMVFTPYSQLAQIAIIYDADKLTTEAQNSFLKTLEESGDNTIYILTTSKEGILLPTILSRSLKIYTKDVRKENKVMELPSILGKNLIEAFNDIEKISKEKTDTQEFLTELESYFQQLLEKGIGEDKHTKEICDNIHEVQKTRKRIDANGNRRLLLENLFLVLTT